MKKNNVISFMNMKGGVCKTTLCVNLGYTLSKEYNKKVLIIDMDPQFNATQYVFNIIYKDDFLNRYRELESNGKTIFHLYNNMDKDEKLDQTETDYSCMFNTRRISNFHLKENYITEINENLHFIVGDIKLVKLQIMNRHGIEKILTEYIRGNDLKSIYDYILIDSPPTYSSFFMSSYLACDTYIVPLKPDFVASIGLTLLNTGIKEITKAYPDIKQCLGIVYTLIDPRNTIHNKTCEDLEKIMKDYIFQGRIDYYKAVPKGIEDGKFMNEICEHDIDKNIRKIAEELIKKIGDLKNE